MSALSPLATKLFQRSECSDMSTRTRAFGRSFMGSRPKLGSINRSWWRNCDKGRMTPNALGVSHAVLKAALSLKRGRENAKTFEAKRCVPWLCAYTGARVGEMAQLRKEDVRPSEGHWLLRITPEAGTVKTDEAREVVLHPHLVELAFTDFVKGAEPGHLFLTPASSGDVLGPLQGVKNRVAEFVRTAVLDKNVAPNHAWRHRFKTVGIEAGIEHRILDAIQGHHPRNVAEGYGKVTIKTQAAGIAKLPRYKVP
jgi:integrase